MWLAKKAALSGESAGTEAAIAKITIGGRSAAAERGGERRELTLISPPGIYWLPGAEGEALIMDCGGESAAVGCVQSAPPAGLVPGELLLSTGGASIYLKSDGSVVISGSVAITGTLTVNGSAVALSGGGGGS